jgi:hypothetical protein
VYDWWPWPTFVISFICGLSMGIPTLEMVLYSADDLLFAGF